MTKKKRTTTDPLEQIAKYIESKGWSVIVIGPAKIQQQIGAPEFNFEFVVNFTGAKKETAATRSKAQ